MPTGACLCRRAPVSPIIWFGRLVPLLCAAHVNLSAPRRNRSMPLMKLEPVSLSAANVTEKMVQEQIADDASILGLGKLELRDKERIQAHAGRLDLLLQDPETLKRYEVELQLGPTDESHIIRTIEY